MSSSRAEEESFREGESNPTDEQRLPGTKAKLHLSHLAFAGGWRQMANYSVC